MLVLFIFVIFCACANGRIFQNPVVDKADCPDPGVVFYQGTYYAVTTTNNDLSTKFPIRISKDLQDWSIARYVFNENNWPVWSTNIEYWAAEIHVLSDDQFRVYFTTRDAKTQRLAIGAAFASNILGPYHALDRPLVLDTTQDVLDSTLINDDGVLYLVWKGSEWMYLRQLESDGLGFAAESETFLIMRNDQAWEGAIIEGPWFIKRNGTFYMFYSGSEYCGDKYAVGVARSSTVLGLGRKEAPLF